MLAQYKKPRKNPSAKVQQKKVAEAKREVKAKREAENNESSDDSDISDSSDSDYEEILISSMKRDVSEGIVQKGIVSKQSERRQEDTKPQEIANHANHFTETPKSKSKSKKVVIKKYYNYKPKSERKEEDVSNRSGIPSRTTKQPEPKKEEVKSSTSFQTFSESIPKTTTRTSYIGIGARNNPTVNMSNRLSNRILNW